MSGRIYAIAVENPYVTDPITIIDGNIIWYGEPLSNANFILEGKKVPTKFYPIFRFVGKRTAQNIIRIINMDDTTDRAEYKDKIE